jgi:hypothetical protein
MAKEKTAKDLLWADPKTIHEEYEKGVQYKKNLGTKGLYEQNRINERFYAGDQWHGASVGSDRPLVRYNVIKRIAEYKQAVIGASPVAVNFSAEGVPNTLDLQDEVKRIRDKASKEPVMGLSDLGVGSDTVPTYQEVNLVMSAMSDYFKVTAERLQLEDKKERVLRNSYCSGTGVLYTYWDEMVKTGLYADDNRKTAITGDIACEVLDIENVYFGDPSNDNVQEQPYIIVAKRETVDAVKREAKRNGRPDEEIETIKADSNTENMAGELGAGSDDNGAEKISVLTKFYKEWNDTGTEYKIMAVKVTEKAVIREPWDIGIRLYPFATFLWERRRNCAYGDSEVTYLIPNQIAINRMITASVWAVMIMGMPIMVVNTDLVQQQITNDPGQIVPVIGDLTSAREAIAYVNPPNFSPRFSDNVEQMIAQTLTQSGANDAALGDVRPDNTSAIIAVREAATMPLQMIQNRFYTFHEDVARIWAEFWVKMYKKRALKVDDDTGTWYMPFDGERYEDMLVTTKIDVGASNLWSEAQSIATLDNLFDRGVIDVVQYLQRLPRGTVPNVEGLLRSLREANAAVANETTPTAPAGNTPVPPSVTEQDILNDLSPEALQQLEVLPANVKGKIMNAGMQAAANVPEGVPTGQML